MSLLRCRRHTCKIIVFTSLIWCILDILILLTYSDCSNGIGFGCVNHKTGKKGSFNAKQVSVTSDEDEPDEESGDKWDKYPRHFLRSWTKARIVPKQKGMPGEMGKSVQIPSDQEEEKKTLRDLIKFASANCNINIFSRNERVWYYGSQV